MLEPTSSQEELQVEKELQQTSCKDIGDSSQVPATPEGNYSTLVEVNATTPVVTT